MCPDKLLREALSTKSAKVMASIASTAGTARMATQGSWRPFILILQGCKSVFKVSCSIPILGVGLNDTRPQIIPPADMPPQIPP